VDQTKAVVGTNVVSLQRSIPFYDGQVFFDPDNAGEAGVWGRGSVGVGLRCSAAGRMRQDDTDSSRGSIFRKRPSRNWLFGANYGGVVLPADGDDRSPGGQRAFFNTTRLPRKSKPPRSMVIGWSGVAGLTEFDLHTVTPSIENFSNRSTPLITGFPMRTAGIRRLPHQPERVLE